MQKIRPDMDIGKNIQSLRYKNNLTQDQVIAKLNLMGIVISKSTYAKLETNRMNIKVSELVLWQRSFIQISMHSLTDCCNSTFTYSLCVYNNLLKKN